MFQRQILHLDMDTFFVSVERLRDPSLCGRPVVVGSDNPMGRGVVAAASYEARAHGIHSAMALRHAYRLCPEARFVRGSPEAYSEASGHIRSMCADMAPVVEMASIDEAYLDLTGTDRLHGSPGAAADRLQRRIANELRLPVSFGWGENKLLAKVASARSKPSGLLRVYPGQGRAFLAPLALRRLPGIGPKNEALLSRYGLERIGHLERLGERRLHDILGEPGRALYHRCRGEDDSPVVARREPKSMGREHTFETDTGHRPTLHAMLSLLSERLACALRKKSLRAHRLSIKLRYSDFKTVTRAALLPGATSDDRVLCRAAVDALERAYTRRVRARLVGLTAHDLSVETWQTLDLFEGESSERIERLAHCVDGLRQRYGFDTILRGRSWEAARPVSAVF